MVAKKFLNREIKGEFGDSVQVENGNNAVYIASKQSDDSYTTAMFKPDAAEKVAHEILDAAKRARGEE